VVKSASCVPKNKKSMVICQVLATWPQKDFIGLESIQMMLNNIGFVVWIARETNIQIFGIPKLITNFKTFSKCLLKLPQKCFLGFWEPIDRMLNTNGIYCVGNLSEKENNVQNLAPGIVQVFNLIFQVVAWESQNVNENHLW